MNRKSTPLQTEAYKGVRDFYPKDQSIQKYIFSVWRKAVESFGFEEYNASIIEPTELYTAKSGQEIVSEQTYSFVDRGEREISLRPEMTPTVARMVAAKRRELGFPLRLYSIPNVFRYERPQRGRLREHWQLNVDLFGQTGTDGEIEIIELASKIMHGFGAQASDFTIKISSRKLINSLFSEWYELNEIQSQSLMKLIDRKNKIDENEFYGEAEKIVGKPFAFLNFEQSDELHQALALPLIKEAYEEINTVITTLKNRGVSNVEFDQTIIRGFDYYTGIIFEVFDTHPENNRALFGGGRYDDLLSLFGDEKVPACGFGMGDVTIADFLETRSMTPEYIPATKIMICLQTKSAEVLEYAYGVAQNLRDSGINTAVNYLDKSIGDQLKQATKLSVPYAIIIGEDEAQNRTYKIKDLNSGTEYTDISTLNIK